MAEIHLQIITNSGVGKKLDEVGILYSIVGASHAVTEKVLTRNGIEFVVINKK